VIPPVRASSPHASSRLTHARAAYTAAVALYRTLGLPLPFARPEPAARAALVVNGAAGAVGAFALQLARLTPGVGPVVGVAGAASAGFARDRGAEDVLDYRSPSVGRDLAARLAPGSAQRGRLRILDTVTSRASVELLASVAEGGGALYAHTARLSPEQAEMLSARGAPQQIWVGSVHDDKPPGGRLFGEVMTVVLERFIAEGKIKGQPYEVVPGGLDGVKDALVKLRDRKTGNAKFVVRIADTPGLH
jgi:NADPH2:quinone reductase